MNMISLSLSLYGSSHSTLKYPLSRPLGFSSSLPNLKPSLNPKRKSPNQRRIAKGSCRAEFSQDAPLAFAIGACMLNSLIFPITPTSEDDTNSLIDSTDSRFAVMGIISFIPYFNWLSWVFAWLDTGRRRYVVYSIVYLAPYLRSNLSLSPEESWLPIASIVFCIIHIQLEASIRNGDFEGFQILNEVAKNFSPVAGKKDGHSKGQEKISGKSPMEGHGNLPSAKEHVRKEIEQWQVRKDSVKEPRQPNKDLDEEERKEH